MFDLDTGKARRRSSVLVARLAERAPLPPSGRLLDVGCGNGATLRAFAEDVPGWSLYGYELAGRDVETLRQIPGFAELYHGPARDLPGRFDLITLIHSLEHFVDPHAILTELSGKLVEGGSLLVQVPDLHANPFDPVVADHLCHFDERALAFLVTRAGFAVERVAKEWVVKELSLVAEAARPGTAPSRFDPPPLQGPAEVLAQIEWLQDVMDAAVRAARGGCFGLFGTAIAATWLFGSMGDRIEFFVDEDPSRIGGRHLDRPILAPDQVPAGCDLFLALTPAVAERVRRRLRQYPIHLHSPPPIPRSA